MNRALQITATAGTALGLLFAAPAVAFAAPEDPDPFDVAASVPDLVNNALSAANENANTYRTALTTAIQDVNAAAAAGDQAGVQAAVDQLNTSTAEYRDAITQIVVRGGVIDPDAE